MKRDKVKYFVGVRGQQLLPVSHIQVFILNCERIYGHINKNNQRHFVQLWGTLKWNGVEEANNLKCMLKPVNVGLKYWRYVGEEGPSRFELHQNSILLCIKQNIHMQ
jgi:hypothetical protein